MTSTYGNPRPLTIALLLIAALAFPAGATAHHNDAAQTARITTLEAKVAALEARIAALEDCLCALPTPTPTPTFTPAPSPSPTPTTTPSPSAVATPPAPTATPTASITATPTPTPVPTPTASPSTPSSGNTVRFTGTQAAFVALTRDMTVDVIELSGTYGWEKTLIDVDRSARPLTIRGGTFTGPGRTSEGIFFLGLNSSTKWITMTGQTFDGVTLASSGAIEVRSGERLTIRDQTFRNLRRDPTWSPNPYNTWGIYISGANRVIRDLVVDNILLERPPINRDLSAIQIDSSSLTHGAITITNVRATGYAYAFYENVATSPLTLDTWSITDTSWNGMAVRFNRAVGTYRGLTLTGSGGINVGASGMVPG